MFARGFLAELVARRGDTAAWRSSLTPTGTGSVDGPYPYDVNIWEEYGAFRRDAAGGERGESPRESDALWAKGSAWTVRLTLS